MQVNQDILGLPQLTLNHNLTSPPHLKQITPQNPILRKRRQNRHTEPPPHSLPRHHTVQPHRSALPQHRYNRRIINVDDKLASPNIRDLNVELAVLLADVGAVDAVGVCLWQD